MTGFVRALTAAVTPRRKELSPVYGGDRGWTSLIREPFAGAWQKNKEETVESVLSYGPVFACQTLIASDIAKMNCQLVQQDSEGIWKAAENNTAHAPVLRKPNNYQTRIQFFENWVLSKLSRGNTYVLKARDNRRVVTALYVLDPCRVKVLVSDTGEAFYELRRDYLSKQKSDTVVVPASEIIHDRFNCLFHPLVGLSPLYAATLPASQGLKIQRGSAKFWQNGARPSGILTAPGEIKQAHADELKAYWQTNFSGDNTARVAVLGDGMKYEQMSMTSVDAQLVEQLEMTAKQVCSVYHVPPHMVGAADPPSYNNIEALSQQYYSQCLQRFIEDIELLLDEGLELPKPLGTMFDLNDLLRMDTATQIKAEGEAVQRGIKSPNEARKMFNLGSVEGGETPYMQEQNWPLQMLADRELPTGAPAAPAPMPGEPASNDNPDQQLALTALFEKELREALNGH